MKVFITIELEKGDTTDKQQIPTTAWNKLEDFKDACLENDIPLQYKETSLPRRSFRPASELDS